MKKNGVKKFFISIILFGILLGLTVKKIEKEKKLNFFEKSIKDTVVFVQKIFYAPIKFTKNKIEMYLEFKDLYKKYDSLKDKASKAELYYAQIEELQKEIKDLKDVLKISPVLSEYTYVYANVVNRNNSKWYNTLTIDKGIKNGIKDGDAVITNKGLIGKIYGASNFSSSVKLLTTDEILNKISIKIKTDDNFNYGLLSKYNILKNVYEIEGITDYSKIKEGDMVTTSGLTDYFPSGLLIGYVKSIIKDEYDLNSVIEVTPSVDYSDISVVAILNRKASK